MARHSVPLPGVLWKRQLSHLRDYVPWGAVGVSQHPCMVGYLPIQDTTPEITKKKGLVTVE